MLILLGLSWCHKFQLHFMSLMPQIKRTFIKIECFKIKPCPLKTRWQEFVGAISHNTSFTHCPILDLILAWFGWKLVGNWSFSINFGLQHSCCFCKRMQLNMDGLRLNTLFLYYLFHNHFLYFLLFFFNFPSFCSLYFFFFYSFFFYFLLQRMLILLGLSWCHKFQLHFMSLMP